MPVNFKFEEKKMRVTSIRSTVGATVGLTYVGSHEEKTQNVHENTMILKH